MLDELGIDSLKIIKVNEKCFKITVAESGAYERFKIDSMDKMDALGLKGRQRPYLRPELVQELDNLRL